MTGSSWCPSCREPVRWAITVNRKRLALDPEPHPGGNQAAYRDGTGTWLTRQLADGQEPYAYERRFMPHVATCFAARRPAAPAPVPVPLPPNVIPIGRAFRRGAP